MLRLLNTLAQAARTANRRRLERRHAGAGLTYAEWIRRHDTLDQAVLQALQRRLAALPSRPLISVLMPVYNPEPQWLAEAIASVRQQIYPHWQLCIADDCSTDPAVRPLLQAAADSDARIRVVFRASNGHIAHASQSALDVAAGEFVALLDHDDVLPAHALLLNAEVIAHLPATRVLYSDEDVLRFDGQRQSPNFKPDWNPELMRSQNLVCHLGVYQSALVRSVGGFRPGFEGAQDYDLALRCLEQARDDQVVHITCSTTGASTAAAALPETTSSPTSAKPGAGRCSSISIAAARPRGPKPPPAAATAYATRCQRAACAWWWIRSTAPKPWPAACGRCCGSPSAASCRC